MKSAIRRSGARSSKAGSRFYLSPFYYNLSYRPQVPYVTAYFRVRLVPVDRHVPLVAGNSVQESSAVVDASQGTPRNNAVAGALVRAQVVRMKLLDGVRSQRGRNALFGVVDLQAVEFDLRN